MAILGGIGHVLLVLLKILLILLVVILLVVLFILILPIRYEAAAKGDSRKGLMSVWAEARVKVIGGLILFCVKLKEGEMRFSLKILRFSLKRGKKRFFGEEEAGTPDVAEPADTAQMPPKPPPEDHGMAQPPVTEGKPPEEAGPAKAEQEKPPQETGPAKTEQEKPPQETGSSKAETKKIPSIPEMILDLTDSLGEKMDRILPDSGPSGAHNAPGTKQTSAGDQLVLAADKAVFTWDQIHVPENARTIRRVKTEIFRLLRAYLPRQIRMEGEFGTGDPAVTGQILGGLYAFYPVYCESGDVKVGGNFEEQMIRGKVWLMGHIRPVVAVGSVIRLLFDKNIRKLVKKVLFK